ncbi:hypothetical protein E2C01_022425 [Portunus trituberculatus]|uniref:Uncharacterized protein n=1 Tax=Portunus trituberculatus TaxID=210409 RepID=A0A5B7E8W1_PORTR|nr:hypothetical protein [Portunus trituberculatus]
MQRQEGIRSRGEYLLVKQGREQSMFRVYDALPSGPGVTHHAQHVVLRLLSPQPTPLLHKIKRKKKEASSTSSIITTTTATTSLHVAPLTSYLHLLHVHADLLQETPLWTMTEAMTSGEQKNGKTCQCPADGCSSSIPAHNITASIPPLSTNLPHYPPLHMHQTFTSHHSHSPLSARRSYSHRKNRM